MDILEQALASLEGNQIPGDVVFRLYDTFGFPADLTNDIARERGELDIEGYEAAMQAQRKRSQESGSFQVDYNNMINVEGETEFLGYAEVESTASVRGLFVDGEARDVITAGESAVVILDRTLFTVKAVVRLVIQAT